MTFKKLIKEYKEFRLDDPIIATFLGVHDKDNELSDLSEKKIKKDIKKAKELLNKASSISEKLSFEEEIDLDLIKLELKKIIAYNELTYNNLRDYEQKPILGGEIIHAFLYLFLKDPRAPKLRLDAINLRFAKLPGMIKTYLNVLKKPIKRWKDIEIEELEGISDLFDNILNWAKKEHYNKIYVLKKNIDNAKGAIKDYIKYLNKLPLGENFSIGEEKTKELIKLNGIDYSIEEIYNITKDFFKEHNKKINSLCKKLKIKYNLDKDAIYEEVCDFIKNKFSVPIEEVINLYKKEQKEVIKFLKKTNYFILPKSDKLKILQTPRYLVPTIPVGAMFTPAPFEKGPKTSLIYLTIDKKRQKDQNSLMIKNTMIHEGIPGHHLQFAIAYENKSVIKKLTHFSIHAEGWTTYLEDFMTNIGFIKEDIKNEYLLISYSDFARLGARVAIDLFFMTGNKKYLNVIENFTPEGNDVFEMAKSLLKKATRFTDARCEGELNWYSKERSYPLCYLIGNKMVTKLKKEVFDSTEDKIKATKLFHEYYLKEGIMPLTFLRKVFIKRGLIK